MKKTVALLFLDSEEEYRQEYSDCYVSVSTNFLKDIPVFFSLEDFEHIFLNRLPEKTIHEFLVPAGPSECISLKKCWAKRCLQKSCLSLRPVTWLCSVRSWKLSCICGQELKPNPSNLQHFLILAETTQRCWRNKKGSVFRSPKSS